MRIYLYVAIVLALLGAGTGIGYKIAYPRGEAEGIKVTSITYDSKLKQQKADAQALYEIAVKRNLDLENNNRLLTAQRNQEHDSNSQAIDDLSAKLSSGRVRDPYAKPGRGSGCPGTVPSTSTGTASDPGLPTQDDGLLSKEFAGFLWKQFTEAERDAEVARVCYETYGRR